MNGNGGTVENTVVNRRMEELSAEVDLIVFVVPKDETFEVLKEVVELGHKNFWFQPQTFGKRSKEYLDMRPHLKYTAKMTET